MTTQDAREKTAIFFEDNAKLIREKNLYAPHVTQRQKDEDFERRMNFAREIREGKHDGNFTIAQRIRFYETGECEAFLP